VNVEDNKAVVRAYYDAVTGGRRDEADALLADDATWWIAGKPEQFALAAEHGWSALAELMSDVQETLEKVRAAVDDALQGTADGVAALLEITSESSTADVASRLAVTGERFESARSAAAEAARALDGAHTAAQQADAHIVQEILDSAEEHLIAGGEAVASAVTTAESEQRAATAWGRPTTTGAGTGRPVSPAAEPEAMAAASAAGADQSGRLPNAAAAKIPEAKFLRYSMDPSANNNGKWRAWRDLGYDIEENRPAAADDVTQQLRDRLPTSPAEHPQQTAYGLRLTTGTEIRGPNGRRGTLRCVWQYDLGSDEPRLITNWLEVHREEQR
jgi:ketosteroid isomerase-like protein